MRRHHRSALLFIASALLADGIGYILKPGDALGNGRVTAITAASVTFAVSAQPGQGPTTVTLRLPLD